jgi:hypothetical protein
MSRGLDTANEAAITDDVVIPVLFAELDFDSGFVRAFSGIGTINWGGYDWVGTGIFGSIDGLEETSDLSKATVTFTLTGIPNDLLSVALNDDYQGRSAKVYVGFFDRTTYQLVSTPFLYFFGKMDTARTKEGKEFSITITAENEMAAWSRPNVWRYSDQEQQARFAGDTALRFMPHTVPKEIIWGRKA